MKNSKILLSFILVFLLTLPLNAQQKNRFKFGLYTGWSKGSGDAFYLWRNGYDGGEDFISYTNTLKYHIGGYIQRNFTQKFALQLNMNYQSVVTEWERDLPYRLEKVKLSILSVSLCPVLRITDQKLWEVYGLAGGGLSSGKWPDYQIEGDVYFNVMAGLGIKIFPIKSSPRLALNLGGSFHHLFDGPWVEENGYASYFRFQVGFEF
jgi:hypothetical protein